MNVYGDFVYASGTNNPMPGVAVSVTIATTMTLIPLFDSTGQPINNPVTTDQNGYFEFYAAPGTYDIYTLGVKQYEISLSGNTTVPDPLAINNLTVNQTATLGQTTVTLTDATDTQLAAFTGTLNEGGPGTTNTNHQSAIRAILNFTGARTGTGPMQAFRADVLVDAASTMTTGSIAGIRSVMAPASLQVGSLIGMVSSISLVAGSYVGLTGVSSSINTTSTSTSTGDATASNCSVTVNGTVGRLFGIRGGTTLGTTGTCTGDMAASTINLGLGGTVQGSISGLSHNGTFSANFTCANTYYLSLVNVSSNNAGVNVGNVVGYAFSPVGVSTVSNNIYGTLMPTSLTNICHAGGTTFAYFTDIAKVAGKTVWSIFASGDAPSHFGGTVLVGTTTDDGVNKLRVVGTATIAPSGFTPPFTLSATMPLKIYGNTSASSCLAIHSFIDGTGFHARLMMAANTLSGGQLLSGSQLGVIQFASADSTLANLINATIQCNAEENFTDTARATSLRFATTPVGSTTTAERMRIAPTGNVLIGSATEETATTKHRLQVTGGILTLNATAVQPVIQSAAFAYPVHVVGSAAVTESTIALEYQSNSAGNAGTLTFFKSMADKTLPNAADVCLGQIVFGSSTASLPKLGSIIQSRTGSAWVDGVNTSSYISFWTTSLNSTAISEKMRLTPFGELLIATTTAFTLGANDMLQVNGGAYINGIVTCDTVEAGTVNAASGTLTDMRFTNVPIFANNAAAVAGGLIAGYLYRTGADPDHLCIVH